MSFAARAIVEAELLLQAMARGGRGEPTMTDRERSAFVEHWCSMDLNTLSVDDRNKQLCILQVVERARARNSAN